MPNSKDFNQANTKQKQIESDSSLESIKVSSLPYASATPKKPTSNDSEISLSNIIGQTINHRFKIISRLGSGGMSEVYKAQHLLLDKTIALKILHQKNEYKANSLIRFQQEAKAVSSLDHPCIVKIQSFGKSESGQLFLAMDYLEGKSLQDILENESSLEWQRVISISLQIASGLKHAHENGVIHRDLKPGNIIVQINENNEENIKIVDFGIAKLTSDSGKITNNLTTEGKTCGSPPYMSPEQCLGETVDKRSDIYSLGCLMFELLTGQQAIKGRTSADIMSKHLTGAIPFFKIICPEKKIPACLEAIVRKCLAKDKELRYQNMSEIITDLESIKEADTCVTSRKNELISEFITLIKSKLIKILSKPALWLACTLILILSILAFCFCYFLPQAKILRLHSSISNLQKHNKALTQENLDSIEELCQNYFESNNKQEAKRLLNRTTENLRHLSASMERFKLQNKLLQIYSNLGFQNEYKDLANRTVVDLWNYAISCKNRGTNQQMELATKEGLDLCKRTNQPHSITLGRINILVSYYLNSGKLTEAENMANEGLELCKTDISQNSLLLFGAKQQLASVYMAQKKYDRAKNLYQECLSLAENQYSKESLIYKNILVSYKNCLAKESQKN